MSFADQPSLAPIVKYIDDQFEAYHAAERSPGFRRAIPDTRIHALLYFIAPTGHAYVQNIDEYSSHTIRARR